MAGAASVALLFAALGCSAKPSMDGLGASGAPVGAAGMQAGASSGTAGTSGAPAASGASGTIGAAGSLGTSGSGGIAGSTAGTGGSVATPPMGGAGQGGAAGASGAGGSGDMPNGTGPGDWGPGDYPPDLMSTNWLEISGVPGQGDNVRQYKVHVPASYKPEVPTPVVFCIHGLGQDGLLFCVTGTAMNAKSDEAGFILVMPNGYQNSWNAGTCCGAASSEQLDDVALFRAIFAEVGKHVNIDRNRVYATGLSNGGYMSYRLACDASDIFTAVAPVAAAIGTNDIGGGTNGMSDFTACMPGKPVSILDTHGTQDPLIPYSLQAPTLTRAAMNNGCGSTTKPAPLPASGGDTTCVTYEGCPGGIELTACSIEGGGHCWFGSEDCGTGGGAIGSAIVGANSDTMKNTDAVWKFFERLSR